MAVDNFKKKKNKKYILKYPKRYHLAYERIIPLLVLSILLIIMPFVLFSNNKEKTKDKVEARLVGNELLTLAINSDYLDSGFKLFVDNKEIDSKNLKYTIKDDVNPNAVGKYNVKYEIEYEDKVYELTREVEVVDKEKPVITISANEVEVYYCKKENIINLDYQAVDNYDGVITDKVVEKRFDDHIELSVKDSSGNEVTAVVNLVLTDVVSPIIELKGSNIQYVPLNGEYIEEGAIIQDGCGKKIEELPEILSGVDTSKAGTYVVTYRYTTKEGKIISKERTVIVYESIDDIKNESTEDKVIYLTFDDGPGRYTNELLDILNKYDVKATFFVTSQFKDYVPIIKREYEEGHKIAVHTKTHKWSIYQSVETYIKDFNDMNDIIYSYTGEKSKIFRFPGGSSNTVSRKYSKGVVRAIKNRMTDYGYVYFDWNVDSEDAAGASSKEIYDNVITGIKRKNNAVVLMHDIKKNTIATIEDILVYAIEKGYTFKTLDEFSPTVHHRINN